MERPIEIAVQQGDVTRTPADVLVLKYAAAFHGVDRAVATALGLRSGPAEGSHLVLPAPAGYGVGQVIMVGVAHLGRFGYAEIRRFAADALRLLQARGAPVRTVLMTLHGAGYGLDESEAALAQVGGLLDAIGANAVPAGLERITIVEIDPERAERVERAVRPDLARLVRRSRDAEHGVFSVPGPAPALLQDSRLQTAGAQSDTKPHAFVAMPFDRSMDDVYHYGIERPIHDFGFLCARIDKEHFLGDIMERVKQRIESAPVVIAELTGANPNVYLEVGYAWGVRRPTIFLAKNSEELRFDTQGHRCITYDRIQDLEKSLLHELHGLRAAGVL